jgi:hypothetical protein
MSFKAGILNAYDWRNRGDRAIIEAQMAIIRPLRMRKMAMRFLKQSSIHKNQLLIPLKKIAVSLGNQIS